jgi:hypothetical protein
LINPRFSHGAAFLAALDQRRLTSNPSAPPSRIEQVAQAIIKRHNPIIGQPEILLQYDAIARRYQLIGGRHNPARDASLIDTLVRELAEELPQNSWLLNHTYHIRPLIDKLSIAPTISPTFGALTQYQFAIFHIQGLTDLTIGTDDAWISINNLLNSANTALSGDFFPPH